MNCYNITFNRAGARALSAPRAIVTQIAYAVTARFRNAAGSMSDQPPHVVTIGEVLLELTCGGDGRFALAYGGDTFNTAVYLARAGLEVGFASALGDDPYSDGALAFAAAEGISRDLILRAPGRLPGLSLIDAETPGPAKRHFHHWRESAPAGDLFELPDWNRVAEGLLKAKLI